MKRKQLRFGKGFNVIFGKQTDDFHFVAGGDYHKQKAVYAGARDYSKYALYLYGGSSGVVKGGSSRTMSNRASRPGNSRASRSSSS